MSDVSGGSQVSLSEANRDRAEFSRHGGLGAAGYISLDDQNQTGTFLSSPGEVAVINPPPGGLPDFHIGVAWDNIPVVRETSIIKRFFKKKIVKAGIDLDLGCLYELKNGIRGGMQAFGEMHGALQTEPYIFLSGDERRGDREGPDEIIQINGVHWNDIDRILVYVYIYEGARSWASVKPQIQVRVPGEQPMVVTLAARKSHMSVCAVAQLENVRGGIKMTSVLEYFPGHAEMDRAFGYGLEWESGQKD
jgi:tellurite resistance protein TerA